jgi:hypothetical protein
MANVKQIEAAIGPDHGFAGLSPFRALLDQRFQVV